MDLKSYILKLLVLPKSATFVTFAFILAASSSEMSVAFSTPPGLSILQFQTPPGL